MSNHPYYFLATCLSETIAVNWQNYGCRARPIDRLARGGVSGPASAAPSSDGSEDAGAGTKHLSSLAPWNSGLGWMTSMAIVIIIQDMVALSEIRNISLWTFVGWTLSDWIHHSWISWCPRLAFEVLVYNCDWRRNRVEIWCTREPRPGNEVQDMEVGDEF